MTKNGHFSLNKTLKLYSPKFYEILTNIGKIVDGEDSLQVKYYTIVTLDIVDMVLMLLKEF